MVCICLNHDESTDVLSDTETQRRHIYFIKAGHILKSYIKEGEYIEYR